MAEQNFIAKKLCGLAGDLYTKESTEKSLHAALLEAQKNVVPLDIRNDKWILFSDHHKGGKNRANDFRLCEEIYLKALEHYFEAGYNLCVMGDVDELWEELPGKVIENNSASIAAERRFNEEGRYIRLWGNHDEFWSDPAQVQNFLQPLYGTQQLNVPVSILLDARDGGKTVGKIFLVHGHQGTQNEGRSAVVAKWLLRYIWRTFQSITGISCNTPATDWKIRRDRDRMIYNWVANQPKLALIAGHTHTPVFESDSHRARLYAEISSARQGMEKLSEGQRIMRVNRIETLTAELQKVEDKLSAEEKLSQPIENPLPCYFNTGCCAFADGDITGIEISDGEMRLVRWPDDDAHSKRKVLQAGQLEEIFEALK